MQEKVKEKRLERGARTRATDGSVWRTRLRRGGTEMLCVGCGWLMGQAAMLFGTYPLGVALLCASGRHVISILVGLLACALTQMSDSALYVCVYVAATLVRIVAGVILDSPDSRMELPEHVRKTLNASEENGKKGQWHRLSRWSEEGLTEDRGLWGSILGIFTDSICLRMATGAVCVFILALYRLIVGGFRYYDLFAAIFVLLITPAATLVFSVCLNDHVKHKTLRTVSEGVLLFSLIWAARGVNLLGFPLTVILALFFTLYACHTRGSVIGACAGLLCGLAFDPLQAPSLLLAALVYSFLNQKKERHHIATVCACFAMLAWSLYARGVSVLFTALPGGLIAGSVFTLVCRWMEEPEKDVSPDDKRSDCHDEAQLRVANARCQDSNNRFRGISDAFASLSEVFYNLSDRFRRPGTLDLRHLCDSSFDAFCKDCPNKTVCWGLEYAATLNTVNGLISQLHTRGKVTREHIPTSLKHRCDTLDSILNKINNDCARLTGEMLRNNRTEIFAMDYEAAANIINDALEEDDGEYRFDVELEQKITDYLNDAGIQACGVTVYGNRRRQILVRGVDIEQSKVTAETLRADLGEMCGLELGRPVFEVEDSVTTMILQARKKILVSGAQNNVSADGGVSGDSVNLFSNKKDYFYALISDGMGAGKEAAMTSGLCSVFLEKMLRAGNRAWTSLRMLNNMIRSRDLDSLRECSSTVDLLELDLMTAEASFIKSGAAPSFVVRGSVVHRLQAGTAPIGIIRALDAQATPFSLRAGDTVVMISDGIMQNDPECEWLSSYLSEVGDMTPQEIVYRICVRAAGFDTHDDCSAIALRILGQDGAF